MQAINSVVAKRMHDSGELVGDIEFKEGKVSMHGRGNFASRLLVSEGKVICPIWGTTEHTHEQDVLDLSLDGDVEDLLGMLADAGIYVWEEEPDSLYTRFSQPRNADSSTEPALITGAVMWHSNVENRTSVLTVITDARSFQVNIKP